MKDHISDEQVEAKIRELLKRSAADDSLINDIAGSPTLWWNIRRQIDQQAAENVSSWPWMRWLAFGIPAAAAAAVLISFLVYRTANTPAPVAVIQPEKVEIVNDNRPAPAEPEINLAVPVATAAKNTRQRISPVIAREPARKLTARTVQIKQPVTKPAEIKTEFIALSYARDPESGQLVRVKVPSSMMVSLGLVESVRKPNDLVDAEVLVGDDGLTRAIRFIRKEGDHE
jgi:hypothetical protein